MSARVPSIPTLQFETVPGIPLVQPGDDLVEIIAQALTHAKQTLRDGDIVCVAQKIISKAEGRQFTLADVKPGDAARVLAAETDKEPALCQLILDESESILRKKPGVIIVRHRLGHVGANAGIDQSNIEHGDGDAALLLPVDPDASAAQLRAGLRERLAVNLGVMITDSMNRPWRLGTIGGSIGVAGVEVLEDLRGGEDMFGRELKVSMVNRADSLAATATLLMGETIEGTPVVLIRGLPPVDTTQTTADMIRPAADDLFT
ncbi:MAG: coenzyme F420-0:L-glutamate ligase [Gammaproteobacteria bacterium]|jgi:coenzyme F420-0:L-glutamate ligase/coenzyme F420-1:gamma-L-glutamate ligase